MCAGQVIRCPHYCRIALFNLNPLPEQQKFPAERGGLTSEANLPSHLDTQRTALSAHSEESQSSQLMNTCPPASVMAWDSCIRGAQKRPHHQLLKRLGAKMMQGKNSLFCLSTQWNKVLLIKLYLVGWKSPFMSSWALSTSNLRALRKRRNKESGLSPKRSRISLARPSPSAALSFIKARRSFSDDARLSSVSFSSSFAWKGNISTNPESSKDHIYDSCICCH